MSEERIVDKLKQLVSDYHTALLSHIEALETRKLTPLQIVQHSKMEDLTILQYKADWAMDILGQLESGLNLLTAITYALDVLDERLKTNLLKNEAHTIEMRATQETYRTLLTLKN